MPPTVRSSQMIWYRRMVWMPTRYAEHVREQAFHSRTAKTRWVADALDRYYREGLQPRPIYRDGEKIKEAWLFCTLTPEQAGQLEATARIQGVTMSEVIRQAIAYDRE